MNVLAKMDGLKTYSFAAALALLAVLELAGIVPAEVKEGLSNLIWSGIIASLRHAMSRQSPETAARLMKAAELLKSIGQAIGPTIQLTPSHSAEVTRVDDVTIAKVTPGNPVTTACLLLLLWPAVAMAGEDVRIVGPSGVPAPGYPVDLYVQGDLPEGTKITWDHFPKVDGVKLVEPKEGGRLARINTMSGTFKFIASITPPGDEPGVLRYHDLTVPGVQYVPPTPPVPVQPVIPIPVPQPIPPPTPHPHPQPVPPVNPDPIFPPGQFQLAEDTYRLVMSVPSPNRRGEVTCLSSKVVALINSLRDAQEKKTPLAPQTIVQTIGAAFDTCLPSPVWDEARNRFTDRVAKLYQAGRLRTNADWQAMAEEALQGLNAAAAR